MNLNKKVTFAVEKGFRFFQEGISFFHFFMIEFPLKKEIIQSKDYRFSLKDNNANEIYTKNILIDIQNKRIITPNSHEDPLVSDEKYYYVCFQIDSQLLASLTDECSAFLYDGWNNDHILISEKVGILSEIYKKYTSRHYSKIIEKNTLISDKDCILTLHLGDNNGVYSEDSFELKSQTKFDFSQYLNRYEYIGVQCSYENEVPEIEEKHIVIGQKGIFLSGYLKIGDYKIMPPLPFLEQYQKEYSQENFIQVSTINELIQYYSKGNIKPRYFESNLYFLLPTYTKEITYNQDGLYSLNPPNKKNHFMLETCKSCPKNSKCLQVIPSRLSSELFKKNMMLEDCNDCIIFKLIP